MILGTYLSACKEKIRLCKKLFYIVFFLTALASKAHAQGTLFGTTIGGGVDNRGLIFKTNADGTGFTALKEFSYTSTTKVSYPIHGLIQASNGKFYGVATGGPVVIYEFDPINLNCTGKFEFTGVDNGDAIDGNLIETSNGVLYGVAINGGSNGKGTIFSFNFLTSTFTKKYDFGTATNDGSFPIGRLLKASNGKIYGVTTYGGSADAGILFEFDPASSSYLIKYHFATGQGRYPNTELLQALNGKLYGATLLGGSNDSGTIFEYDINLTVCNVKYQFTNTIINGNVISGALVLSSNNKIYGVTQYGGANNGGAVFEFDLSSFTYTKKADFSNGMYPFTGMAMAPNGKLYGTTSFGGANGVGVIFEYDPLTSSLSNKIDLAGISYYPNNASMTLASNGKFFGTTIYGGETNTGQLFEYDPATSVYTKKIDFAGGLNGLSPGAFTLANDKLYAISQFGGIANAGTILEYDPAISKITKKFDFDNKANGQTPVAEMVLASNGKLYGTTLYGGTNDAGVLFEYDPVTSVFTKKMDFHQATVGSLPTTRMISATNGKLYGTARAGGSPTGQGVIYEFDPLTGSYTKKYIFEDSSKGSRAEGGLVQASNGKLYGTTISGGINSRGVLFEFDPISSTVTTKVDFDGANKGSGPRAALLESTNHKLYGMTWSGGTNDLGTLFEFDPSNSTFTKKLDFDGSKGSKPFGSLMESNNAKLYGMTSTGGTNDLGVLFEYTPATSTYSKKLDFTGANGASPWRGALTFVGSKNTITGLAETKTSTISVSPNPAKDWLTVSLPDEPGYKTVTIYQLDGKVRNKIETTEREAKFAINDYVLGLYIIKVTFRDSNQVIRFVKL